MKDFHKWISEVGDLHALFYALDEQNGINVSTDIIEEASDECWSK